MNQQMQAHDFIIISKGGSLFIAAEGLCYKIADPLLTNIEISSHVDKMQMYNYFGEINYFKPKEENNIRLDFVSDSIDSFEGLSLDELKEDVLGKNIEDEIEKLENKTVYELLKLVNKKISER